MDSIKVWYFVGGTEKFEESYYLGLLQEQIEVLELD